MNKLRVLDLFSGIGGFSLGLERTGGFETVAFCEIEPFPRKVLAKHWPGVPCYHDVRTLTKDILDRDGIAVDVICGGFPCQDISNAGKGAGIEGERSGLWKEYARLVCELQPRFVFVENVAALLGRGLGVVLGDLAAIGYDAEWHCIPASAVGAPHRRDRLWVVAYAPSGDGDCGTVHARNIIQTLERGAAGSPFPSGQRRTDVADTKCGAWEAKLLSELRQVLPEADCGRPADGPRVRNVSKSGQWAAEPDVGRVVDGVPDRSHRLKALGNAVVPQIPELIGNAILQSMRAA